MSKKTTKTKTEKQAEKKQPTKLRDKQLDKVQGGMRVPGIASATKGPRTSLPDPDDQFNLFDDPPVL